MHHIWACPYHRGNQSRGLPPDLNAQAMGTYLPLHLTLSLKIEAGQVQGPVAERTRACQGCLVLTCSCRYQL